MKVPWREVFAAAAVAAVHAVVLLGRLHPDELYQAIEPGLSRAFGYGILAWEWQTGLRNWAVPGLISWILRLCAALNVTDPWAQRAVIEVPQFFLHAAMLAAVWRFSARRVGPTLARWCLWLVALYGPLVFFGGRTMSESLSVAFLVWGLERLDDERAAPAQALLGGALLGLGEVARYGSAAVIVPAMLWLLLTRRWRAFGLAAAGGLAVGAALGALDRLTWGDWFHSFRVYVDFNLLSGQAVAAFGALPWYTYLQRLFLPPFALLGFVAWRRLREQRAWLFAVTGVGYALAISATPHKEARFLYPTLILLTVAAAPAFVKWASGVLRPVVGPRWPRDVARLAVLSGALFFVLPTPYDADRQDSFQLTVAAGRAIDGQPATGVVVVNEGVWGAGGYFYLGHNVPWFCCDVPEDYRFQQAMQDRRFNRVLTYQDRALKEALAAGFRVHQVRGLATLLVR